MKLRTIKRKQMEARELVAQCERELDRKLVIGEMSDLLLDNFDWLAGADDAKRFLVASGIVSPMKMEQYRIYRKHVRAAREMERAWTCSCYPCFVVRQELHAIGVGLSNEQAREIKRAISQEVTR